MSAWIKVITEPLGLAGFALFLLFAYLGKLKKTDKRRWPSLVAFLCAAAALTGGLVLAYVQATRPAVQNATDRKSPLPPIQQTNQVTQQSTGDGSPNVQGVNGDVVITVDQSHGKVENRSKPASEKKPDR